MPPGQTVLLGFSGNRIVSVTHFGFEEQGDVYMIWATATALGFQGRGVGRVALQLTVGALAHNERARGRESAIVTHIDPRNDASRALFKRAEFEYLGRYDGYESWIRDLP